MKQADLKQAVAGKQPLGRENELGRVGELVACKQSVSRLFPNQVKLDWEGKKGVEGDFSVYSHPLLSVPARLAAKITSWEMHELLPEFWEKAKKDEGSGKGSMSQFCPVC